MACVAESIERLACSAAEQLVMVTWQGIGSLQARTSWLLCPRIEAPRQLTESSTNRMDPRVGSSGIFVDIQRERQHGASR